MSSVTSPSLEEIISKGYASSVMMRSPFLLLRELKMLEEEGLLPSRAWLVCSGKQQKPWGVGAGGGRYPRETRHAES